MSSPPSTSTPAPGQASTIGPVPTSPEPAQIRTYQLDVASIRGVPSYALPQLPAPTSAPAAQELGQPLPVVKAVLAKAHRGAVGLGAPVAVSRPPGAASRRMLPVEPPAPVAAPISPAPRRMPVIESRLARMQRLGETGGAQ